MSRPARGFTLMEIMVALAVLALALGSLIKLSGEQTASLGYLQSKTVAHWVAMNRVAELAQARFRGQRLRKNGVEEQLGFEWHWRVEIQDTPVEEIKRVEVQVRRDPLDERPVTTLLAFIENPPVAAQ